MPSYLQFEITLIGINPAPSRTFQLQENTSFRDLHVAIQDASDSWKDYHMWEFSRKQSNGTFERVTECFTQEETLSDEQPLPSPETLRLQDYFMKNGDTMQYAYDFGDNWEIEVCLIDRVESEEVFFRKLIEGDFAFPPEDCGGIHGYLESALLVDENWPFSSELKNNIAANLSYMEEEEKEFRLEWLNDWILGRFDCKKVATQFDIVEVEYDLGTEVYQAIRDESLWMQVQKEACTSADWMFFQAIAAHYEKWEELLRREFAPDQVVPTYWNDLRIAAYMLWFDSLADGSVTTRDKPEVWAAALIYVVLECNCMAIDIPALKSIASYVRLTNLKDTWLRGRIKRLSVEHVSQDKYATPASIALQPSVYASKLLWKDAQAGLIELNKNTDYIKQIVPYMHVIEKQLLAFGLRPFENIDD